MLYIPVSAVREFSGCSYMKARCSMLRIPVSAVRDFHVKF
ncbi:hypothetical protein BRYFOR_07873 [Marvinbryantia formatexigens DSM 14469]|uniref:Uncharacterized protein n=1 Tax=Marvinbryantia formatexigens DSM 14469 TaxID=478749 RepID=C6LGW3_9FIRM|nr:hypothetical protein BRYFOR_07873 [Marvinbryantia formatexigens DSM 14469]